ncbi:glycosyltransferase [Methylorubrum aminovorans]
MALRIKQLRSAYIERTLFDEKFYLDLYSDVAMNGMNAYKHYSTYGWKEGRDPSSDFSTLYYKDKYLSSNGESINPLTHYSALEKKERARIKTRSDEDYVSLQRAVIEPYFDEGFYVNTYDIGSYEDPLSHYLSIGWMAGYNPTDYFDGNAYIASHQFIKKMGICPFYHYVSTSSQMIEAGQDRLVTSVIDSQIFYGNENKDEEKRAAIINSEFDEEYYLSVYADVREARIDPLQHYLDFGSMEGRNPNEIFWSEFYASSYLIDSSDRDDPFYHYLTVGKAKGYKPNPYGRGIWTEPNLPKFEDWTLLSPANNIETARVIVVIPVYKGFDETVLAIFNSLRYPQKTKFALHVINDAGPDNDLNEYLSKLADLKIFIYSVNSHNRGFVATVNHALSLYAGKDIILLNSDAIPYNNWIDRLASHADNHSNVATITPMSNNATIFSYPKMNFNNRISLEVAPATLDLYAGICNRGSWNEVPTGVGFCLYMTAAGLEHVGMFDEATFGKGYGEENDYCLRARNAGYINIQANDIFVYHSGGASFDSTYKKNMSAIERKLHSKHPNYQSLVHAHVAADPAQHARRRLDCYRFCQYYASRAVVLFSHSIGGGIETHLASLAKAISSEGTPVIIFRHDSSDVLKLELIDESISSLSSLLVKDFALRENLSLFEDFLQWLSPKFIHVHSFVGLSWFCTRQLMESLAKLKVDIFYTLHDYSPVCHRCNLVTPTSSYCGMPGTDVCRLCIEGDHNRAGVPDPVQRREAYTAFLSNARTVFAPSEDVSSRIRKAIPLNNIQIRPHEERLIFSTGRKNSASAPTLRVAAVGAIGPHKGSYIIHSLAVDAQIRQLPISFEIVGYSNITAMMLSTGVKETGRYFSDMEAIELLTTNDYDVVLLPSIWPETYCYALSLALAAGITPAVFDLGAQAQRLLEVQEGIIIDSELMKFPSLLNDFLLSKGREIAKIHNVSYRARHYSDYFKNYYGIV